MKGIIIYGAGGLGRDIVDIVSKDNKFKILGFIDDNKAGDKIKNFNIFNFNQAKRKFNDFYLVLAFGDPVIKSQIRNKLKSENIKYTSIISKNAYVSKNVDLGKGCIIYPGAIIGSNVKLEDHVLICGNTSIGHDVTIKKLSSIAFNCSIGGNTIVGKRGYIGSGSHIKDELKIGNNCIIGMNSSLLESLPSNKTYYNKITKIIKENNQERIF